MKRIRVAALLLFTAVACPRPSIADFERFAAYNVSGYVGAGNLTGPATKLNFGGSDQEFSTVFDDVAQFIETFEETITGTGGGFAHGIVELIGTSGVFSLEDKIPIARVYLDSSLTSIPNVAAGDRGGAGAGFNISINEVSAGWRDTITIIVPGLPAGIPLHVAGNLSFSGTMETEAFGPEDYAVVQANASMVSLPHRLVLAHSVALSHDNHPQNFLERDPQPVIPINMDLIIGQPFSFETSLRLIFDGRAIGVNGITHLAGYFTNSLAWGGITSVTNALTGEPITNWTVSSDSGFDYSRGVPEPASALLLIVGYCGGALLLRPRR